MKKLVLQLLMSVCFNILNAQSIDGFFLLDQQVSEALQADDEVLSFKLSQKLLKLSEKKYTVNIEGRDTMVRVPPFTALLGHSIHYLRISKRDSMYFYLNKAVEEGFDDKLIFLDYFEVFRPIINSDSMLVIKEKVHKNKLNRIKNDDHRQLADKVINMFERDQYQRKNYEYCEQQLEYNKEDLLSIKKNWVNADSNNQTEMVKILDTYGYPGRSLMGYECQNYAFYLVQHFSDVELQKKYYPLLQKAAELTYTELISYNHFLRIILLLFAFPHIYSVLKQHQCT